MKDRPLRGLLIVTNYKMSGNLKGLIFCICKPCILHGPIVLHLLHMHWQSLNRYLFLPDFLCPFALFLCVVFFAMFFTLIIHHVQSIITPIFGHCVFFRVAGIYSNSTILLARLEREHQPERHKNPAVRPEAVWLGARN